MRRLPRMRRLSRLRRRSRMRRRSRLRRLPGLRGVRRGLDLGMGRGLRRLLRFLGSVPLVLNQRRCID
jgi:hypothetical protein